MKANKKVRGALITSVISLVLCFTMLLGTTLAWFTDTASTSVNKIQAGNLKVGLKMWDGSAWVDAEGKRLQFETADGRTDNILWEPGCRYQLPQLKVVNEGDLKLKFKVAINGIDGDVGLNKVIDWTIDGRPMGAWLLENTDHMLDPNGEATFTIQGHMQESAGNDYQGKFIDGIGITVYATQATGEYDSFTPDYDHDAIYDEPVATLPNIPETSLTETSAGSGVYTYANVGNTFEVEATAATTGTAPVVAMQKAATPSGITVSADGQKAITYDITVTGHTGNVKVKLFVGKNLSGVTLYHNGVAMDAADYDYVAGTGVVTFTTDSFSPFTVVCNAPVAVVDGVGYYDMQEAVNAALHGGTVVLLKNANGNGVVVPSGSNLTIDFNDYTYNVDGTTVGSSGTETNSFQLLKDSTIVFQNGTLTSTKAKILVQNYSNLTLNNMVLNGTDSNVMQYVASNNNGNVVINNTTINAGNAVAFDVYSFGSYTGANVTVTGNSVINGKIEVGADAGVNTSNLALNIASGTINGTLDVADSLKDKVSITGGTINLTGDMNTPGLVVTGNVVLNLNGHQLYNTTDIWNEDAGHWSLVSVRENGNLVVTGNGTFAAKANDCFAIDVKGATAKCVIENGEFIGNIDAVYVSEGALIVNGGKFHVQQKEPGADPNKFVLNCLDANYKDGSATIVVNGGTFEGFNPAAAKCESPVANFVANGKTVVEANGWYTVQ